MLNFFLKGLLIGLAIAAPVGPIGILCIQRSLHNGFKVGLMTGIGAALADGVYGLIVGFGLTAFSAFLMMHQFWIRSAGGAFLIYLSIKLFITKPKEKKINQPDKSPWHACITTFFLTLANPATILSFIAIFAGLGLGSMQTNYSEAILLVFGITLGSACWWLILSGGVAFILHKKLNPALLRDINWISGAVLLAFGLFALFGVYTHRG